MNDPLAKPVDIDALLLSKRLEPLNAKHLATLEKVAALDVSNYSEMEVRSYVIDPLVAMLGYEKGTVFEPYAAIGLSLIFAFDPKHS
jgi:hypothetical protein